MPTAGKLIKAPAVKEKSSCSATRSQWGCALFPTPQISAPAFWEHHLDRGRIQAPLPPSILPPPPQAPKTTAPRTPPRPMALLCVWVVAQPGYCLAQLPSTYFMHKQTTRRRWPGSSDIKTTMSSRDHS